MSLFNIFEVAGSAMSAQSVRLNTTASNLANADSVSSSLEQTYRSREPVFAAVMKGLQGNNAASAGVRVAGIVESNAPLDSRYEPDNPMANEEGYVFLPNVNVVDQMANMISASRSYQNNVEVLNTSKQLLMATIRLGQ
ncbi:MAG: flagellar basal body rod protein FlgC [Gammaproteobacteria bacterium]|jgi:flagellar basal-body rod protein FlgC|nr:flagellar basal body rod protein FlgC [Gammaproteobacteria bacterium]MCW9058358.1 flagellar basal body rod protein FlgC [Gammaproteobacteria bacterium]